MTASMFFVIQLFVLLLFLILSFSVYMYRFLYLLFIYTYISVSLFPAHKRYDFISLDLFRKFYSF